MRSEEIRENDSRPLFPRILHVVAAVILLLSASVAHAAIPATEREALIALYNATDGPNWSNSTNWLGGAGTECTWYGVTCNSSGNSVVELRLGWNSLSGTIPPQIGNLSSLTRLHLDFSQLSGSIPAEVGNLASLRYLNLSSTRIGGAIPSTFGNLSSLQSFAADNASLEGGIPAELGGLTSLTFLSLIRNQLTGAIPSELGNLLALEILQLQENLLTGEIPPQLGNLQNLRTLSLFDNSLTGPIPAELGNLASLTALQIGDNQLSGPIPPELGSLASINFFNLRGNRLSGDIPPELSALNPGDNFSSLGYNALTASDPVARNWADLEDPDWATTQTIAPDGLQVSDATADTLSLTWTPIPFFYKAGGYEIFVADSAAGPYTLTATVLNKTSESATISGLSSGQTFFFKVRTYTEPHTYNQSRLESGFTPAITGATESTASPDVLVDPEDGVLTTETGIADGFIVVLATQPSADVTIHVTSGDDTEGRVDPGSLSFTSVNWAQPQTVTVFAVDDDVVDGDQTYQITLSATSGDPDYDGIAIPPIEVSNRDDDRAGITVSQTGGTTVTTESGAQDQLQIVLGSEPTADVTLGIASSNRTEGSASPQSVTFTPLDWSTPQTVTVTGVDDSVHDGPQRYVVMIGAASSGDGNYDGMNNDDVEVVNGDDESARGVIVIGSSGLITSELDDAAQGGSAVRLQSIGAVTTSSVNVAMFGVMLSAAPDAEVIVSLSSTDTTEGTVVPGQLVFDATNWSIPQMVTVSGVEDFIADGSADYGVEMSVTSGDPVYDGLAVQSVPVINADDESYEIIVTPLSGLLTTEAGGAAMFSIMLSREPVDPVTIALQSSDPTEGLVEPLSVTFDAGNWRTPRRITVVGVDDDETDSDIAWTVGTAAAVSDDGSFAGIDPADPSILNLDDDGGFDPNGDTSVSVADIFYLINFLFANGPAPIGSGDANGDGQTNVADIFYLINHLFASGPAPVNGTTAVPESMAVRSGGELVL
ncbi:MAG: fibronectin type III domain-containing protein, partial [Acidobacteria bacterium]|nr:fibronectin type III domain-containing protein [Acidobacteriota bacterium]